MLMGYRVTQGARPLGGPLQPGERQASRLPLDFRLRSLEAAARAAAAAEAEAIEAEAPAIAAAGTRARARTTAEHGSSPVAISRSRLGDEFSSRHPAEGRRGDDSVGDTETDAASGEDGGRGGAHRVPVRMCLTKRMKTWKSVFTRSIKAPPERRHTGLLARQDLAVKRIRVTVSMLPSRKEQTESRLTRAVRWLNARIRMEAFFAFYALWTLQRALVLCCLGMFVFLCLGVILLVLNDKHVECKLNYEEYALGDGGTRYECLAITSDACGPGNDIQELEGDEIYVYYELENFNQNGGQIIWNRNDRQLAGHIFTDPSDVQDCEPYATRVVDNVTKVLHPCGALAWHVFNDNFLFFDSPPEASGSIKPLPLLQAPEDILWPLRWQSAYKNPSAQEREAARDKVYFWMSVEDNDDGRDGRVKPEEGLAWAIQESLNFDEAGPMVENSHFIQWMDVAALPTFRKLYGKLKGPLKLPLYANISINYDVKPWGGKKAVVLVAPSAFYGRTLYMGIAYLVFGCILLLFSLYLLWRLHLAKDGTAGDIRWRTLLTRSARKNG